MGVEDEARDVVPRVRDSLQGGETISTDEEREKRRNEWFDRKYAEKRAQEAKAEEDLRAKEEADRKAADEKRRKEEEEDEFSVMGL